MSSFLLSCTTLLLQSLKDHCWFALVFRSERNRLQRYCFFLDWPNFLATFLQFFITFFVSGWFSALHFSVWFLPFSKLTRFKRKSAAKVLLFFGLTKFFSNFFTFCHHFLCKWLIFSITFFSVIFAVSETHSFQAQIGCKGTAFFWNDQILELKKC